MANTKKIVGWVAITTLLIVGTYFIVKGIKANKSLKSGEKQDAPPIKQGETLPTTVKNDKSIYPIKKGSRGAEGTALGDAIRTLQLKLGIGVDGDWGNKTDKAFKEKTGKTEIKSEAEFEAIINQLDNLSNSQSEKTRKYNRSSTIINELLGTKYNYLQAINTTVWKEIGRDNISDSYYNLNSILNLKKGQKMGIENYLPISVLNNGNLVIQCFNGNNKGLWEANPLDINLV